jgi:hypothetical protein
VGATFEQIGGFGLNFVGGDDIEYYLDYILFNPVASIVSKWRTLKLLRWVLLYDRLVDLVGIFYLGDDVEDDKLHTT